MNLYFKYISIILKGNMQDKKSFVIGFFGQVLASLSSFVAMYFMFKRFNTVRGFTFYEILLCFSVALISFSIAECFARGFDCFSRTIANCSFDRMLVRPRGLVFQVLTSSIELTRLGRLLEALVVFIYAIVTINNNNISGVPYFSGLKIFALFMMIVGSIALFCGMFTIYATLCFFTLEGLEVINIFTDGARQFGEYPLAIYGKRVLQFCTFIFPYALVQYYPFLFITGKQTNVSYCFFPIAGLVFLVPVYFFWKFGVRHYVSTGS